MPDAARETSGAVGVASYPYPAPIDSYGNGGFRFAGMSHRGSLLFLPTGVFAWEVSDPTSLTLAMLLPVIGTLSAPGFLILGTGQTQMFPSRDIRRAFLDRGLGLEPMDTGAACRTYNVLLAEKRPVAAAVIAVP
ncbi:MAG: Mth938-like domain-containing protein [Hyphomicrobiaceae bacterium]